MKEISKVKIEVRKPSEVMFKQRIELGKKDLALHRKKRGGERGHWPSE